MRYIVGRGFFKSYNTGPRPFSDRRVVAPTQGNDRLFSTLQNDRLGHKTRRRVGRRKLPIPNKKTYAPELWRSLTSPEDTVGRTIDLGAHIPSTKRGKRRERATPLLRWGSACNQAEQNISAEEQQVPRIGRRIPSLNTTVKATSTKLVFWRKSHKQFYQGIPPKSPPDAGKIELRSQAVASNPLHSRITVPKTFVGARKMHSHIQFLSTPTADTPGTALVLHFDDKRYLIGNIHEGTQRASIQRGQKLLKVSDIFITGKTEWKNTGGLIGMILTLADASTQAALSAAEKLNEKNHRKNERQTEVGQEDTQASHGTISTKAVGLMQKAVQPVLTIHGGPNITHTLATARRFVFRKGMPVKVEEHMKDDYKYSSNQSWEPTWVDPRIQVWAMAISPSSNERSSEISGPRSPKKRPFDEFVERKPPTPMGGAKSPGACETSPTAHKRQDQELRQSVVAEMFNSAWRHDNLIETPLRDVQMPASLYTRNEESNKLERYYGAVPDGITPLPDINVLVRKPWPGAMINHLPSTKPSSASMSYIIRNHRQRGRFMPAKAKELKVPEGPLWNKLASGQSVQSMDSVTIEPGMVLEEGKEGAGVAVIDLPSVDYIDNLVKRPEWKADRIMDGVGAIIWLLGRGVGADITLRNFMQEHADLKHIVSSEDYCPNYLSMDSSATAAIRLNQVDPSHYVVPVHDNINLLQPGLPQVLGSPFVDYIPAQRGHVIKTGPLFQFQGTDGIPNLDTAAVLKEIPKDVLQLAQAAREELASESTANGAMKQSLPSQDAEVICLGTGSALPSKYRNVSATLVRVPGYGSYLMDCGENTLGQLKRVFTPHELAEVFHDLKVIWISHLHADHHLGTASVIKAWHEEVHGKKDSNNRPPRLSPSQQLLDPIQILLQAQKLFVASHEDMLKWLGEYSSVENYGYDQIVPLNCFPAEFGTPYNSRIEWNGQTVSFSPTDPKM